MLHPIALRPCCSASAQQKALQVLKNQLVVTLQTHSPLNHVTEKKRPIPLGVSPGVTLLDHRAVLVLVF
jgi:hypothetical protein